jgi:DNA-binding GntR family transcriptional regulator
VRETDRRVREMQAAPTEDVVTAASIRALIEAERSGVAALVGGTNYARVRDVIRRDIIAGTFAPGSRLKAVELASRYGVSPVPVREALQQLLGEGLVVIVPNRGASVRNINGTFIRNVCEVRELLRVHLTAKGAARMTDRVLVRLEAIEEVYEDALAAGDDQLTIGANHMFHLEIRRLADNPEAEEMLQKHFALTKTLRLRVGYSAERRRDMPLEHRALIEACRRRDPVAAAEIARRHTRSSIEDLLRDSEQARDFQGTESAPSPGNTARVKEVVVLNNHRGPVVD